MRPGMRVVSVNGHDVTSPEVPVVIPGKITHATLIGFSGEVIRSAPNPNPVGESPLKYSLWILGAMFALLGATVVLRRPDLKSSVLFGFFSTSSALALAVGPAAGGPTDTWALITQFMTLLPIGVLCLAFVASLAQLKSNLFERVVMPSLVGVGVLIAAGYIMVLLVNPLLYEVVQPASSLYLSLPLLGAVVLLVTAGKRKQSAITRQQTRLALAGIAGGTLPIAVLTMLPEALMWGQIVPDHISVLAVGLMPICFAYAILQFQLMGIRRLVHRGMVNIIASGALLVIVLLILSAGLSVFAGVSPDDISLPLIVGTVVFGILIFAPLRRGARWLVDRLVYQDVSDYRYLIGNMQRGLFIPDSADELIAEIATMLARTFNVESALLFLGRTPEESKLAASAGERSQEVRRDLYPRIAQQMKNSRGQQLVEMLWESQSVLVATLGLPDAYYGYIVLGPRHGGEVFLQEEKEFVAYLAPILALSIEKSQLSEELRRLNGRLIKAGETERSRIATDIHDGPLQKAQMLSGAGIVSLTEPQELARQLVSDLREICSRLRPAILDDLGVVPALEWQLDQVTKRHGVHTELTVDNIDDDDRLDPEVELALFRVTQEATMNAVKHARCTSIHVLVSREDGQFLLEISDDGAGFEPGYQNGEGGGFGLTGMRERVVQLNGYFDVSSALGVGSTVTVTIPLKITAESPQEQRDELPA